MKLKAGYVERRTYERHKTGPVYIILTPDGHVWPREGAEEKHPECFEYEFQVGDWVIRNRCYYRIRLIYHNIQEAVLLYGSDPDYRVKDSVPLSELKPVPRL